MTDRFAANTYLIGAQKSGTTWLAALLDQHPSVCVSDPKETHYFTHRFDIGPEAYRRRFSDPEAPITLDASTSYSFLALRDPPPHLAGHGVSDPVPERIAAAAPDAKFIYILRNPVDRAISAWKHNSRGSPPPPGAHISMIEVLDSQPMLELTGRYGDQIERWFEVFPRDRFLFLRFEDLTRRPEETLTQVFAHLGLSPHPISVAAAEGEKHGAYTFTALGRFFNRNREVKARLARVLPASLRSWLAERFVNRPAAEVIFEDREAAAARFAQDREKVAVLTGLSIDG